MKDKFAHWNVLFILYLKRDWKMILAWVIGLGAFCGGFVPAMEEIAKGEALVGMYETLKNPAMIAMVGGTPITNAADYTIGAMYGHMMLLFCGVFAMIVAVMHVVGHARKEEERGLTEFICTYSIGRHANAFALMMEEFFVHILLALFISGLMILFQVESMDAAACMLFGCSVGLAGMIGAVIALLMSQLMASSGGATASALGIVGLMYMIRGGMDMSGTAVNWWNPMEWTYKSYPFAENNWKVFLPGIAFCLVISVISFVLEKGRDLGDGYIPEMGNRKKVKKSLLSIHGFLLRINRGTIIGWIITLAVFGAMYGSIYGDMQSFLKGNDLLKTMFQMQGISIEASFTMTIMVILAGLTFILPVCVMNRLYSEESLSLIHI